MSGAPVTFDMPKWFLVLFGGSYIGTILDSDPFRFNVFVGLAIGPTIALMLRRSEWTYQWVLSVVFLMLVLLGMVALRGAQNLIILWISVGGIGTYQLMRYLGNKHVHEN